MVGWRNSGAARRPSLGSILWFAACDARRRAPRDSRHSCAVQQELPLAHLKNLLADMDDTAAQLDEKLVMFPLAAAARRCRAAVPGRSAHTRHTSTLDAHARAAPHTVCVHRWHARRARLLPPPPQRLTHRHRRWPSRQRQSRQRLLTSPKSTIHCLTTTKTPRPTNGPVGEFSKTGARTRRPNV